MKRFICAFIVLTVLMSAINIMPVLAEEELKVYFYEDFVTGYKEDEKNIKSLGNIERSLVDGEYVLWPHHNEDAYYAINFGTEVEVPDDNKVVLEYKMSGTFYGGSNSVGFDINQSIPTVYVGANTIKAYSYNDKDSVASCNLKDGVVITIVYNNEKPERDIFIDGKFIGTYDMGSSAQGAKFVNDGKLPLIFYNHISSRTRLYYHYFKVYQAPEDYSSETFIPELYKNVGKARSKNSGVLEYNSEFYFNIINKLGFFDETQIGEYKKNEPMTRLQFAGLLANVMNISPVNNPTQIYTDIARRHYMSGTLEALNNMEIMKGVGNGAFGKDSAVTLPMACAALVRALGYKEFAEYYSGYESGYITMASRAGILKGISTDKALTSADVIRMTYNFMNTEIYETVGITKKGYIKDSGDTILKAYHNIGGIRDIVTANSNTSLSSSEGTGGDIITVGDIRLNTGGVSLNQYLGYQVEAYYDIDTDILLAVAVTDKNNTLLIDSSYFENYSGGKIKYEKDSRSYSVALSGEADIIYNGKYTPFSKNLFDNLNDGNITLIDNNNDKQYDVAMINNYINGVVDTKSIDNKILRFKNGIKNISLESYENYDIKNAEGDNVAFDSITENNIVSVMESKDGSYVLLVIGFDSVIGALSEIYSENKTTFYNIDGVLYPSDSSFPANNGYIKSGITGEFFKDAYGKIAAYSEIKLKNSGFAYLLGVGEKGKYESEVIVKLYTDTKRLVTVDTAEKITLDGRTGVTAAELLGYEQLYSWKKEEDSANPGTYINVKDGFKPQIISYKLNSSGDVLEIDTAYFDENYENPENSLRLITSGNLKYDNIDLSFGNDVYLNSGCRVFTVPRENVSQAAEKEFDFKAPSGIFRNESSYNIWAYKTSDDTLGADMLVSQMSAGGGFDSYDHAYIISDISVVYDEEEETAIKRLSYYFEGKKHTCIVKDEELLEGVSKGDIVILSINSKNELANAPIMRYDLDADSASQIAEGARGTIYRVTYGVIYELMGDLFTITKNPSPEPDSEGNPTAAQKELHRIPAYIYIVDSKTGKVTIGSKSDITDYKRDSAEYSKAVFYETKGYDYDLIIIK